jgi:hypothetical protein
MLTDFCLIETLVSILTTETETCGTNPYRMLNQMVRAVSYPAVWVAEKESVKVTVTALAYNPVGFYVICHDARDNRISCRCVQRLNLGDLDLLTCEYAAAPASPLQFEDLVNTASATLSEAERRYSQYREAKRKSLAPTTYGIGSWAKTTSRVNRFRMGGK